MPETTLQSLPATGTFPAAVTNFNAANVAAINQIVTDQNANNASLRSSINACATTPVPSAQLDPTTIQYATVALTLTQLQHLHSAPVSLVAAPGANKMLEFVSAVIEYKYGSAAFTIGTAGNMTVSYKADGSGAAASGTLACTGFFDQTANTIATFEPAALAATAATALLNQPLVLIAATADMTSGTGGTGIVKVAYRVHSSL